MLQKLQIGVGIGGKDIGKDGREAGRYVHLWLSLSDVAIIGLSSIGIQSYAYNSGAIAGCYQINSGAIRGYVPTK